MRLVLFCTHHFCQLSGSGGQFPITRSLREHRLSPPWPVAPLLSPARTASNGDRIPPRCSTARRDDVTMETVTTVEFLPQPPLYHGLWCAFRELLERADVYHAL
jgi:hypothetical protein